ncbi:MAG: hypothetical protein ACKVTZ_20335 [Bacteroidia bacterium]
MKKITYYIFLSSLLFSFLGCEKEIKIKVPENTPQLVVEAYINQLYPKLNYAILSESVGYLSSQQGAKPVKGASIFVTEGIQLPSGEYVWDNNRKVKWVEMSQNLPFAHNNMALYADSTHFLNSDVAYIGKVNHFYKLEISYQGKQYQAITEIPALVPMDSLTYEKNTDSKGNPFGLVTIHYREPQLLGNTYLDMNDTLSYDFGDLPGWGVTQDLRAYSDNQINDIYKHEQRFTRYPVGDTVNYYFNTIDRKGYNFWDSFLNNNTTPNPFTTTVPLKTNLVGENVTGCFTGLGVSHLRVVIE